MKASEMLRGIADSLTTTNALRARAIYDQVRNVEALEKQVEQQVARIKELEIEKADWKDATQTNCETIKVVADRNAELCVQLELARPFINFTAVIADRKETRAAAAQWLKDYGNGN